jgi:hypothetical protein
MNENFISRSLAIHKKIGIRLRVSDDSFENIKKNKNYFEKNEKSRDNSFTHCPLKSIYVRSSESSLPLVSKEARLQSYPAFLDQCPLKFP